MFVDRARVVVEAGKGGDGIVSFRHEKFVDRGGPDGGDGGDGGDVIFVASRNQNTLASFRYQKLLQAEDGNPGSKRKKHGKSGDDLVVPVPVGTVIFNEEELLVDLSSDNQQAVVAFGGHGGFGNAHFVSSRRQAPRIAEKGEKGEKLDLKLELKMIADVGIVGLPNSGKSTLLARISNARPEIADYPFTTLQPNLGVVDVDGSSGLLFADVPGLIEGASKGKGLGDEFLRHVERTSVLLHLIDVYNDVAQSYKTIQNELKTYKVDLSKRPQVVVLNKIEGIDKGQLEDKLDTIRALAGKNTSIYAISAKKGENVPKLLYDLVDLVENTRKASRITQDKRLEKELPILRLAEESKDWEIEKRDGYFLITGKKIERFADRTDFSNPHGVQRLRDIMHKMGIMHELIRKDIASGQKIFIGDGEDYFIEF